VSRKVVYIDEANVHRSLCHEACCDCVKSIAFGGVCDREELLEQPARSWSRVRQLLTSSISEPLPLPTESAAFLVRWLDHVLHC
jgi:hypothetical protein